MVVVAATSPGDGNSTNHRGGSGERKLLSAGSRLGAFLRRTTTPRRSNITKSGSVTCCTIMYNSSARGDGGGIPSNVILLILIIVSLVIVLKGGGGYRKARSFVLCGTLLVQITGTLPSRVLRMPAIVPFNITIAEVGLQRTDSDPRSSVVSWALIVH